jgi:hypothetical protein
VEALSVGAKGARSARRYRAAATVSDVNAAGVPLALVLLLLLVPLAAVVELAEEEVATASRTASHAMTRSTV